MTTSAANENRRPPFTTLATRLIETTRSSSPLRWSAGASYRLKSPGLPLVLHRPGRRHGRGTAARPGRTPRARCPRPWPAARAARRRPWPGRSCRRRASPHRRTRSRSCARPRRRSAARTRAGWTGTRPAAGCRPCRSRACARGRGGARGPGASARRPLLLRSLRGLAGLLPDELALIPHALALVRLGLADLADVRGDLAHQLLVDAPDRDPGRRRDLELDALGRPDVHRVAEPERELEVLALERRAVPDAHDLQALLVAVRHALDHVGDQRSGQPVQAPVEPVIGRPLHQDGAVVLADGHLRVERLLERAPGAGHGHAGAVDDDVDASGYLDG